MSDVVRELIVKLQAVGVSTYKSEMAAASGSTGKFGSTTSRTSALASKALKGTAIAAAAVGVAALKLSTDFDSTFRRIAALGGKVGVPIDEARQHILDLAKATGQDPNSLAQALYFVSSAGLKASQVMPVLDQSAKAAAIGMGSASDVGQLLTSVMVAYGDKAPTATQAMNVLTAAIKDGKAEPADYAQNLGAVIATAAQAGVGFDQLTAAISQATDQGVSASRAITGLRFLISSLENPTAKAQGVMADFGLSAGGVQAELSGPKGLLGTLNDLAGRFDLSSTKGKAAWATIVGGARGAIVANTLVGQSQKHAQTIFHDTYQAMGRDATNFGDAVTTAFTDNPSLKFQQDIAAVKVSLIQLGHEALPAVETLAAAFSKLAPVIIPLAPEVLGLWVAFKVGSGVAALVNGVTASLGILQGTTAVAAVEVDTFTATTAGAAAALDAEAASAAGATAATAAFELTASEVVLALAAVAVGFEDVHLAVAAITGDTRAFQAFKQVVGSSATSEARFNQIITEGLQKQDDHRRALERTANAARQAQFAHGALDRSIDNVGVSVTQTGATVVKYRRDLASLRPAANSVDALVAKLRRLAAAHVAVERAAQAQALAELAGAGGMVGVQAATVQLRQAKESLAQADKKVTDLQAKGKQGSTEYRAAILAQKQAENDSAGAVLGLVDAVNKYRDGLAKAKGTQADARNGLAAIGKAAGLSKGQIRDFIATVSSGIGVVQALNQELAHIPRQVTTTYTIVLQDPSGALHGGILHTPTPNTKAAASGFHGWVDRPTMFLTGERGPERVDVTPAGQAAGGGGGDTHLHFHGPVYGMPDFKRKVHEALDSTHRKAVIAHS